MRIISVLILYASIIIAIGCDSQESKLSKEDRTRFTELVNKYSGNSGLTSNREFVLTIDDKIVAGRRLKELDINSIIKFSVLSNDSTIIDNSKSIKYDLIRIITRATKRDSKNYDSAYEYIVDDKSEWLELHPKPIMVINGRPFKHEQEYIQFLGALKKSDIKSINVLKEPSSIAIYGYKSVLIIETY